VTASPFHHESPPGFRGLDQQAAVRVYTRHLPHWRQDGATYVVTFRLADSLPQNKLAELAAIRKEIQDVTQRDQALAAELAEKAMAQMEHWLDQGLGSCVLEKDSQREILLQSFLYHHDARYELGSIAVMPNHVHLLLRPYTGFELEEVLHSRKLHSARQINASLQRRGALWSSESYDRIVRDAEHLWHCLQYIGSNPAKAGLDEKKSRVWVNPVWKEMGWDFQNADCK